MLTFRKEIQQKQETQQESKHGILVFNNLFATAVTGQPSESVFRTWIWLLKVFAHQSTLFPGSIGTLFAHGANQAFLFLLPLDAASSETCIVKRVVCSICNASVPHCGQKIDWPPKKTQFTPRKTAQECHVDMAYKTTTEHIKANGEHAYTLVSDEMIGEEQHRKVEHPTTMFGSQGDFDRGTAADTTVRRRDTMPCHCVVGRGL